MLDILNLRKRKKSYKGPFQAKVAAKLPKHGLQVVSQWPSNVAFLDVLSPPSAAGGQNYIGPNADNRPGRASSREDTLLLLMD